MNYLKIANKGLIDIEALTLLGASSKRDDTTKIGMFGSGNKYAIAYLLRNNYDLKIYSGQNELRIGFIEKELRGHVFKVITIEDQQTSITTEFGKDWSLWQSIRELYCNAKDEGDYSIEFVSSIIPSETETHFYIKSRAEITEFIGSFDDYFSDNKQVLFECEYGKILSKSNGKLGLFRKGVRCYEPEVTSVYDYDLPNIRIDESRLVSYPWEVPSNIWNLIYRCTNKKVIIDILQLCADKDYIECIPADYSSLNKSVMSEEFKEVLKTLTLAPKGMAGILSIEELAKTTIVPNILFQQFVSEVTNDSLANKFKIYKGLPYIEILIDELAQATIDKAIEFFNECGYEGPTTYKIKVARFSSKDIRGMADNSDDGYIVLSESCITDGVQNVVRVMVEEYIHLKYGCADETRAFQNAALTELVTALKIKNAFLI